MTDSHESLAVRFEKMTREAVRNLKPRPRLDAMAVILNLLRAANRIEQDFETKIYRGAGLSGAAFNVLFIVYCMGPAAPMHLAHLSNVSAASISSVLNTLERYGLLTRRASKTDKRSVKVELTSRGRDVTETLFQRTNSRAAAWTAALTKDEGKMLAQLLRKIIKFHPAPMTDPIERLSPVAASLRNLR